MSHQSKLGERVLCSPTKEIVCVLPINTQVETAEGLGGTISTERRYKQKYKWA